MSVVALPASNYYGQKLDQSKTDGIIVFTDMRTVHQSFSAIPTLIWADGIDVPVAAFTRHLVRTTSVGSNSAEESCKVLRVFLRFCASKNRTWDKVDDNLLIEWRLAMEAACLKRGRIAYCLRTVFSFYRWAEHAGMLHYRVGIYDRSQLPDELKDHAFAIGARRGRKGVWVGLVQGKKGGSRASRATPTEEQIKTLHELLEGRATIDRDALLLLMPELTGTRIFECLQVCKHHLPDAERFAELQQTRAPYLVKIIRKNGRRSGIDGRIRIDFDLLIDIRNWVTGGRQKIVDACKARDPSYVEPDEVFISSTTGNALKPDSVTHLACSLFKKAGIKNAAIHRLRARFLVNIVENILSEYERDQATISTIVKLQETILFRAAEIAGNKTTQSLAAYLNDGLAARERETEGARHVRQSEDLRNMERRHQSICVSLENDSHMLEIRELIKDCNEDEVDAALRELKDSLRKSGKG